MSTSRQTRLPDSREQEYLDTGSGASAWLSERTDASTSRVTLEWDFSQLDTKDTTLGWSTQSERLHAGDGEVKTVRNEGTQLQNLYSSARFLDSNYNADFIPNECLLDPLLEASKASSTRPGDVLSVCRFPSTRPDRPSSSYLLAFPSGRRRNKLTAICLDSTDAKHNLPSSHTEHILALSPTPIEQISSIPEKDGILLGVRNASSVTLYRIGIQPQQNDDDIKLSCRVLASFAARSSAGACPLHFCLQQFSDATAQSSKALIIDDTGSIWQTGSGRDLKKAAAKSTDSVLDKLRNGGHPIHTLKFARISYGINEHQALAVSATCVRLFDFHDPSGDRTLLDLNNGKSCILDMAAVPSGAQDSPIRVLVTDKEVIWLDIQKATNPVLRYKHRREGLTEGRLSTVCDGDILRTILWSPNDCVMTLFAVPIATPVQLLHPPYDLRDQMYGSPRTGLALLPPDRPSRKKKPRQRAIEVAIELANGTVIRRKLETKHGVSERHTIELEGTSLAEPAGLDVKKASIKDLSRIYRNAFFTGPSLSERSSLPTALKLDDQILEHDQANILISSLLSTSCDDYGEEHTALARFTNASALDRAAIAFETLQQDTSSSQQLEEAPFRFVIADCLNQLEASEDAPSLAKKLRSRYGLKSGIYVVKHRDVQESHLYACEQVAMDLALSKTVFAAIPPLPVSNEQATDVDVSTYKSVSELPPIEYGYFKPDPRSDSAIFSAGAQALLSEWNVGADPSARPAYINPYDIRSDKPIMTNGQLDAYRLRLAEGADISASQPLPGRSRAPIASHKLQPVDDARQDRPEQPQTQLAVPAFAQTQTQTQQASQAIPMPFSQVVPGPHGGRPAKKKRVGGF